MVAIYFELLSRLRALLSKTRLSSLFLRPEAAGSCVRTLHTSLPLT